MLRLTDPDLVKLELDPGWIKVAGYNPIDYLTRPGGRVRLLHVRDFKHGFRNSTTLNPVSTPEPAVAGEGEVGYDALLAAAQMAEVEGCYVEREPVAGNLELIGLDYVYLRDRVK
jgi:sugar phosphate isomerase/epimerase